MSRFRLRTLLLSAVAALALCGPLAAATVIQMNLAEMVDRADRIYRGTVLDVREGTVAVGGGELPTVTYRIRVDESFKGSYEEVKGVRIAELKMVGKLKSADAAPVRSFSVFSDLPKLDVGRDYLLLTTPRSAIGLSTMVGLGQGRFELQGKPGQEVAVNANKNLGLFRGMGGAGFAASTNPPEGPVPYQDLAGLIRGLVE
jgi:hypothetical protein